MKYSLKKMSCLFVSLFTFSYLFIGCSSNTTGSSNSSTVSQSKPYEYAIIYRLPSPPKFKTMEDTKLIDDLTSFISKELKDITPVEMKEIKKGWTYHIRLQKFSNKVSDSDVGYMLQGNSFICSKNNKHYSYQVNEEFKTKLKDFYDNLNVVEKSVSD